MRAIGLRWIGGLAALCTAASAQTTSLPPPGSADWEPVAFRSVSRHTRYTLEARGGVRADADCAASALVLPLAQVDLARTPVLHWRWRIERPLAIENERSRRGDDFAARVYVTFRFEPERASLFARARQRIGSRLYGRELPGSAVSFVWTSRQEPGAVWTNPYADETRMVALARGGEPDWRDEAVDVVAAYRRAFERDPPGVLALGIMTDSDDACQHAVARYADFRFTGGES
jgi:hypothetical protein